MGSDLTLVVYMGGTCGDLVSALLDPREVEFDVVHKKMRLPQDRQRLKKPHLFADNLAKDQYLQEIAHRYNSVPSHDIDYHTYRGHEFIGITVDDPDTAVWAAQRFRNVHRPKVWQTVSQSCNISSIQEYAQLLLDYSGLIRQRTCKTLCLENIRSGTALDELSGLVGREITKDSVQCYIDWQNLQIPL